MKASKFSSALKVFILKQGDDGLPVAEICGKAGIRQATYFNWRNKTQALCWTRYDGAVGIGRRDRPSQEHRGGPNARSGDVAGWYPSKLLRPARKRELVDALRADWGVSIKRACSTLPFDRSSSTTVHAAAGRPLWSSGSRSSASPVSAMAIAGCERCCAVGVDVEPQAHATHVPRAGLAATS